MPASKAYSALVFDFDGTLVDSNFLKRDCFLTIAEAHKARKVMEKILKVQGPDRHEIIRKFAERENLSQEDQNMMLAEYNSETRSRISALPPLPGMTRLLSKCQNTGVRCFLSSATPLSELEIILANHPLRQWFESIHGKPASKTDTIDHIIGEYGFDSKQLLVIGDGKDDLESAISRGCDFVAVGMGAENNRHGDNIHSLDELERLIFKHG